MGSTPKELSTGIKASSIEENIEHDNTVADEGLVINEDKKSPFKEDAANDEPLAKITTKPANLNYSANRGVGRTEGSGDSKFICQAQDCDRTFRSRPVLWYHTKSKHEGVRYGCNQCDYQATKQGSLTIHIQSIHNGVKYACNKCDYQAKQQSHLTVHIQSVHEGIKKKRKQR